ncbi:MAG: hypothetical protein NC906_09025 [Candidatus Omnitrophica bacterium]|nr:hypothetical protein [Candidatus Omnitrophota bacterium]
MRILKLTIAFVFTVYVLKPCFAKAEKISAELIAAALSAQEQASEPGLLIRYSEFFVKGNVKLRAFSNVYVRTKDYMILKSDGFLHGETHIMTSLTTYDRKKDRYQTLITWNEKIKSETERISGEIGTGTGVFPDLDMPDPALLKVSDVLFLQDLISGKNNIKVDVSEKKEMIDGYPCYMLNATNLKGGRECQIWVDPSICFCPRQVIIKYPDSSFFLLKLKQYRKVEKEVWIPSTVERIAAFKKEDGSIKKTACLIELEEVTAGQQIIINDYIVKFPPGISIYDSNTGNVIRLPK